MGFGQDRHGRCLKTNRVTDSPPSSSDILHPGRANISKEELREKLSGMYKAGKDQVSVFGLRTQFGGGKTTGFALVYDSPEAMKKFEPHYRLVRVGLATKIEKASRQQREFLRAPKNNKPRLVGDGTGVATPRFRMTRSTGPLTSHAGIQASSARTARRPSAERPRSRVPSPRRRNRRLALDHVRRVVGLLRGCPLWLVEWGRGLCALLYDNAAVDIGRYPSILLQGVTAGFWLRSIQIQHVCFSEVKIICAIWL